MPDKTEKHSPAVQAPKLLLPEEAVKKIYGRIPADCRWAAGSAFIIGLITHMFFLVNKLPNGDDLSELYHYNSMISSGRWLDILSKGLTSYYSIPWASGLICLILLAISCALICSLLGIRQKSGLLAAAAILVAFPTMASYFSYLYYMDLYMLTLLFSVWAVWLCRRSNWGLLPGAFLLALALGNYQAYLGVTAVLCLLTLISDCLMGEKNLKEILGLTLRYLVMGGLGYLLYSLILRWALWFFAAKLSGYQGIAGMGLAPLGVAPLLDFAEKAYTNFFNYFYGDQFFTSPLIIKLVYTLLLALSLIWLALAAVRTYCKSANCKSAKEGSGGGKTTAGDQESGSSKAAARERRSVSPAAGLSPLLLCLLFLSALPLAYNLIYFMAPDAFLHSLMQPQYALFWLMPLMFYELAYPKAQGIGLAYPGAGRAEGAQAAEAGGGAEGAQAAEAGGGAEGTQAAGRAGRGLSPEGGRVTFFQSLSRWLLLGSAAAMFYFFFLTVNISYLHLHLKYEITYATELRILDRIEGLPDYRPDTPVCVVGAFPNENMSLYPYHTQDLVKGLVGINGNLVHHYYNYNGFYKNYLGRQLNLIRDDDEQKKEVMAWPQVKSMPVWPKEGAVAMVEGIVIVKIN